MNKLSIRLLLTSLVAAGLSASGANASPSIHGVVLGDNISTLSNRFPDADFSTPKTKLKINANENVFVYNTPIKKILALRYTGNEISCYATMETLLSRFPPDNSISSLDELLSREYFDWDSTNNRYHIGFTTCGADKVNLKITDRHIESELRALELDKAVTLIKNSNENAVSSDF